MVENVSHEGIDFPTDLRNIPKPKYFNKKKGNKEVKISAPEYREPIPIQPTGELRTDSIDPVVDNQQVNEEQIQIHPPEELRTDSIDPVVKNQQVYDEPIRIQPVILENNGLSKSAETRSSKSKGDNSEEIQGNLRRSTRIPKMSARALHMLSYHPELQESSIFRKSDN